MATTATTGMNNLTTLIKRLEAATSRLEDIAGSAQESTARGIASSTTATSSNGDVTPSASQSKAPIPEPAEDEPETVQAFDTMTNDDLKNFSDLSQKVGGLVAQQGAAFCDAFKAQRGVIYIASQAKEPSAGSPVFMEILKDLQQGMEAVNNVRESNRKVPQENHLAMLADGVGTLGWVAIKPGPDKYIGEVLGGAQFYGNKIMTTFKGQDTADIAWVRSFVKLIGALKEYVKEHFQKGLAWNPAGSAPEQALKDFKSKSSASSSAPAARGSGPPPPPPPPPLPQFDMPPPPPMPAAGGAAKAAPGDMGAIFDQLNRGSAVTSGLRKVDKSEMTHKNPTLRAAAPVPAQPESSGRLSPAPGRKPEALRAKKPSRKELEGNKWTIENFDNESTPIEIEAEKNHSILISRCKSTTIIIKGKANAISIDNCSRLDLLVDTLVSSVSAVSSQNFRLQVTGTLPSIELDKIDGATVYLSNESLATEIYTSKCTAINVTLPPTGDGAEDDSKECPVPEQIRSWVENGQVFSEIVKQEG